MSQSGSWGYWYADLFGIVTLYITSKYIYGIDLFESVGLFFFVTKTLTRRKNSFTLLVTVTTLTKALFVRFGGDLGRRENSD